MGNFLIPHLTKSWSNPGGLLNGQARIQFEQSVPFCAHHFKQVSALICHFNTPVLFEILLGVGVGSS